MARRPFGGGSGDVVTQVYYNSLRVKVATLTMWTAATGGSQITDLLDGNGSAATKITTSSSGHISPFQGPADGTSTMWADAGGAFRSLLEATDLPDRVTSIEGAGGVSAVSTSGGSTITVPTSSTVGLTVQFQSAGTGQGLLFKDYLGAPIFAVPKAGGPAVFGDNFRVHNGSDVFNAWVKLRSDGTIQMAKGDAAGGAGVFAIGAVTTPPTVFPDGTHTLDGATTSAGAVAWADSSGRLFSRRVNGVTDPLTGARASGSHYTQTVGDWLLPGCHAQGTYAMSVSDVNRMYLTPIDVTSTGAVYNTVGASCAVAGTGATNQQFRTGIYRDDGSLQRPNLASQVADFGFTNGYTQLQATAPTATLSSTFTFPAVGRFWFACWFQTVGTVTTYPTLNTANMTMQASGSDLSTAGRSWYVAGVSTALPTTGTLVSTPVVPFVGLRRSA